MTTKFTDAQGQKWQAATREYGDVLHVRLIRPWTEAQVPGPGSGSCRCAYITEGLTRVAVDLGVWEARDDGPHLVTPRGAAFEEVEYRAIKVARR